ncbi:MAG: iron-sulfur cluster-binding domain-containing protein [Acinetobacter sp.]
MYAIPRKKQLSDFLNGSIYDTRSVNFWLQKINPLWSTHEMLGKIVEKSWLADDMLSLKIRCNHHMNFGEAGQHHPVIVEIAGRRYERTYSLTQLDHQHVQLVLKKVEGGVVSTWLCEQAQLGDVIEFGQPYGEMLLQHYPAQHVILLAAGSGITPMYSMLYALDRQNKLSDYDVHLVYWVQHHTGLAYEKDFLAWQNKYPNFKFTALCTRDEPPAERLNGSHVEQFEDLENSTVFACGPSGFVNTAEQLLQGAKHFQSEAFRLTPVIYSDEGEVNVTLTQSKKILTIPKGKPILAALEEAEIKPAHGCRMGICNKCACNKVSGVTKNLSNQSENAEPHNSVRICVNSAQTDLVLDL